MNWYLGVTLALLAVVIVLFAIIAAFTDPLAAGHLETLAETVFSLPLFGGATLVWLGANYREHFRALIERGRQRTAIDDAATAEAAPLDRGWIERSSQTNRLVLSDAGGKILRQWQDWSP